MRLPVSAALQGAAGPVLVREAFELFGRALPQHLAAPAQITSGKGRRELIHHEIRQPELPAPEDRERAAVALQPLDVALPGRHVERQIVDHAEPQPDRIVEVDAGRRGANTWDGRRCRRPRTRTPASGCRSCASNRRRLRCSAAQPGRRRRTAPPSRERPRAAGRVRARCPVRRSGRRCGLPRCAGPARRRARRRPAAPARSRRTSAQPLRAIDPVKTTSTRRGEQREGIEIVDRQAERRDDERQHR